MRPLLVGESDPASLGPDVGFPAMVGLMLAPMVWAIAAAAGFALAVVSAGLVALAGARSPRRRR